MKKLLLLFLVMLCFELSGCEKEKPEIDSVMQMEEEGKEFSTIIFEIIGIVAVFAALGSLNRK
ncbi:MAG: hypothetical protein QX193_03210 [Methylococcales bacterium]|nr:hypothetical protein [Methylococcales bacterium]